MLKDYRQEIGPGVPLSGPHTAEIQVYLSHTEIHFSVFGSHTGPSGNL